jgi:hypothetical protein
MVLSNQQLVFKQALGKNFPNRQAAEYGNAASHEFFPGQNYVLL